MKKFTKIISIILSLAFVFILSYGVVSADGATSVVIQDGKFVLSGNVSDYARISLLVYGPNINGISSLYYFNGINEVKGDFSLDIPITEDAEIGTYTFELAKDGTAYDKEQLICGYYGSAFAISDFKAEGEITAKGVIKGICQLSSYTEGDNVPTVVTAVYENTQNGSVKLFSAVTSDTVTVEGGKNVIKAEITLPSDVTNYFVKVFLLDKVINIQPVAGSIVIR